MSATPRTMSPLFSSCSRSFGELAQLESRRVVKRLFMSGVERYKGNVPVGTGRSRTTRGKGGIGGTCSSAEGHVRLCRPMLLSSLVWIGIHCLLACGCWRVYSGRRIIIIARGTCLVAITDLQAWEGLHCSGARGVGIRPICLF